MYDSVCTQNTSSKVCDPSHYYVARLNRYCRIVDATLIFVCYLLVNGIICNPIQLRALTRYTILLIIKFVQKLRLHEGITENKGNEQHSYMDPTIKLQFIAFLLVNILSMIQNFTINVTVVP